MSNHGRWKFGESVTRPLDLSLCYIFEILEYATEAEVEMIPSPWNWEFDLGVFRSITWLLRQI